MARGAGGEGGGAYRVAHVGVAGAVPSGEAVVRRWWIVFRDGSRTVLAGFVRRAWGRGGRAPVVRLGGARRGRGDTAALLSCYW